MKKTWKYIKGEFFSWIIIYAPLYVTFVSILLYLNLRNPWSSILASIIAGVITFTTKNYLQRRKEDKKYGHYTNIIRKLKKDKDLLESNFGYHSIYIDENKYIFRYMLMRGTGSIVNLEFETKEGLESYVRDTFFKEKYREKRLKQLLKK